VLIAYDRDKAGDRAAEKLSAELEAAGIATGRVLFPKGMDANEYALRVQPAAKSLGVALRNAEWRGNGTPAVGNEGLRPYAPDGCYPADASAPAEALEGGSGRRGAECRSSYGGPHWAARRHRASANRAAKLTRVDMPTVCPAIRPPLSRK
jgi:Toprim-like